MSCFKLRFVKITYGNTKFSCCLTEKKYYVSITKKSVSVVEGNKGYSDNHTENITTLCEINLELLNFQGSGTYTNALKVKWKIRNSDSMFQSFRIFVTFGSILQTQITIL